MIQSKRDRHDKRFSLEFSPTSLADFGMSAALFAGIAMINGFRWNFPKRVRVVGFGVRAIEKSVSAVVGGRFAKPDLREQTRRQ